MDSRETQSMNQGTTFRWGKLNGNPFDNPQEGLKFNILLQFQYTNAFKIDIYQDPLNRYMFKTTDFMTPFEVLPLVNYQGNLYIGKDGA